MKISSIFVALLETMNLNFVPTLIQIGSGGPDLRKLGSKLAHGH